MRLIDVRDCSLVEVNGPDDYPYAILSHTWSKTGEVTFDDMKDLNVARAKSQWYKIVRTCDRAESHGLFYVWIDTCCIDKSSSAELTEAINSMFQWYKKAARCYAYLSDLPASTNGDAASALAKDQLRACLGRCLWFSRGWTLQELIAPKVVMFYDGSWAFRGTKADLQYDLSHITDIDVSVLANSEELSTIPVARRMSWAARRKTTRPEDIAYCLLGIFGVNLPLIYGEGAKAFIRLQEAIAQSTNDLSLFAWSQYELNPSLIQDYYGVLAPSPEHFSSCRRLELIADPLRHDAHLFSITNRGVEFQTSLKMDTTEKDYLMHLYCRDAAVQRPKGRFGMIAIRLVKTSSGFVRHCADTVFVDDDEATTSPPSDTSSRWDPFMRPVHVPRVISPVESRRLRGRLHEAFKFEVVTPPGVTCELVTRNPSLPNASRDPGLLRPSYWDPVESVFLTEGYEYFTGILYIIFSERPDYPLVVLCGLMPQNNRTGTSQNVDGRAAPQLGAWVALHPPPRSRWSSGCAPSTRTGDRIGDLEHLLSQETEMHYPRFLARLGQAIRAIVISGKVLPTMAALEHRQRRPGRKEGSADAALAVRLVKVSVTSTAERMHKVKISLKGSFVDPPEASKPESVRGIHEACFRYKEVWDDYPTTFQK
ncbi:hypothetical protein NEMBOFW57_003963 [Staphylotrichum longicolle]|uniref:Heterokaryon incompatibility domain-containing protein n=1 Tax=Staphylotrichum longicolle TaxID=669026 RepID=A0AAD4FAW3_9PEZI|nr:hypothetical protein NEMBOFW57_003963 [Staphylotrichum longicolle]